jgi:hypothetical protein
MNKTVAVTSFDWDGFLEETAKNLENLIDDARLVVKLVDGQVIFFEDGWKSADLLEELSAAETRLFVPFAVDNLDNAVILADGTTQLYVDPTLVSRRMRTTTSTPSNRRGSFHRRQIRVRRLSLLPRGRRPDHHGCLVPGCLRRRSGLDRPARQQRRTRSVRLRDGALHRPVRTGLTPGLLAGIILLNKQFSGAGCDSLPAVIQHGC